MLNQRRGPLILGVLTACNLLSLLVSVPSACAETPYIHNIYLTTRRPNMAVRGKWVFDISTSERMDDMFSELAALGVNAVTYHSAYRDDGADYAPHNPELKRASRWSPDARPVDVFLDACARHGMAGYLAVFLYPNMIDANIAKLASLDIIKVFRGRSGLAGYVPPIEGSPMRGIDNEAFLDICREVKHAAPKLMIMDYPNGPYPPAIVRLIVERGASGIVDIENVQFHAADERLKNFVISRGMTHLVMGMCPKSRSIVHTHYKYGAGEAWLKEEDSYKVRQGAVITATPDGTSIFSFQHGFWGEETGPGGGDALWRRLVWYEGIVAIQRLVRSYRDAQILSPIAVLIPAATREGGQELVERSWLPFAMKGCAARMFSYQDQLAEETQVIVCPDFEMCDLRQQKELEKLAAAGRTLIVKGGVPPRLPEDVSPRARRILGYEPHTALNPKNFSKGFLEALGGLTDEGALQPVDQPTSRLFGKGRVVRVPSDLEWLQENLAGLAAKSVTKTMTADNLPEGYILEHWRTGDAAGTVPFALLLATKPKQTARDITLNVSWKGSAPRVWFFDRTSVRPLSAKLSSGVLRVLVPQVNDEYGVVLFGNTSRPTLRPNPLVGRCKAGQSVAVSCLIVNTTQKAASGKLTVSVPKNWTPPDTAEFDYRLAPGETVTWETSLQVPKDVEKRPFFVVFRDEQEIQRCIIFPEDGRSQVISQEPVPETAAKPRPPRPLVLLGDEWRGVVAGEDDDASFRRHVPGVCFMPKSPEWDAPTTIEGKSCRYAEILPRLGGANFFVNAPDPSADLLVRITYIAKEAGTLLVYDGHKYHTVGELPQTAKWETKEFRVSHDLVAAPDADKDTTRGINLLFDVRANGIYIHSIEARRAPRK